MFCTIKKICDYGINILREVDKEFYHLRFAQSRLSKTAIQKRAEEFDRLLSELMMHNAGCSNCNIDFPDSLSEHLDDIALNKESGTYQDPFIRPWGAVYERCDDGITFAYALTYAANYAENYQRTKVAMETERIHRARFHTIAQRFKDHVNQCKTCRVRFNDEYIRDVSPHDI